MSPTCASSSTAQLDWTDGAVAKFSTGALVSIAAGAPTPEVALEAGSAARESCTGPPLSTAAAALASDGVRSRSAIGVCLGPAPPSRGKKRLEQIVDGDGTHQLAAAIGDGDGDQVEVGHQQGDVLQVGIEGDTPAQQSRQ